MHGVNSRHRQAQFSNIEAQPESVREATFGRPAATDTREEDFQNEASKEYNALKGANLQPTKSYHLK